MRVDIEGAQRGDALLIGLGAREMGEMLLLLGRELLRMPGDPVRREEEQGLGVEIGARAAVAQQSEPRIEAACEMRVGPGPGVDEDEAVDAPGGFQRKRQRRDAARGMAHDACALEPEAVDQREDIVAHLGDGDFAGERAVAAPGAAVVVEDDTVLRGERREVGEPVVAGAAQARRQDQWRAAAVLLVLEAVDHPICATEATSTRQSGFTSSALMQ